MEEVWKDINFFTLGHDSRSSTPSFSSAEASLFNYKTPSAQAASAAAGRHSFRGMILQDFLAGSFKESCSSAASGDLPQPAIPPTALSLFTSGLGPRVFGSGPPSSNSNSSCPAQVASAGSGGGSQFFSSNNMPLREYPSCIAGGDRRHKRMIKNRESASRSRARKQAYTNEMELEVAHLADENAKLKKQNDELRSAMAAQLPKRKALQKTSSAPF